MEGVGEGRLAADSRGDPQTLGDSGRPLPGYSRNTPNAGARARRRQAPAPPRPAPQTRSLPRTAAFLPEPGAGPADPTTRSENLKEAAGSRGSLTSRRDSKAASLTSCSGSYLLLCEAHGLHFPASQRVTRLGALPRPPPPPGAIVPAPKPTA